MLWDGIGTGVAVESPCEAPLEAVESPCEAPCMKAEGLGALHCPRQGLAEFQKGCMLQHSWLSKVRSQGPSKPWHPRSSSPLTPRRAPQLLVMVTAAST